MLKSSQIYNSTNEELKNSINSITFGKIKNILQTIKNGNEANNHLDIARNLYKKLSFIEKNDFWLSLNFMENMDSDYNYELSFDYESILLQYSPN